MIIQYIKLFFGVIIFSTFFSQNLFADKQSVPVDISSKDWCPKNMKAWDEKEFNHVFILIDRTSFLESEQKAWIKSSIFNEQFALNLEPYTQISVMFIDNTSVQEQKLIWDGCRMKTGEDNTEWKGDNIFDDEAPPIVKGWYKKFIGSWNGINKKITSRTADNSFIYESIVRAITDTEFQFNSKDYKNRKLIVVSDLLQFSKHLSFYAACKASASNKTMSKCSSLEQIMSNQANHDYIKFTKPKDVKNLSVELLFLNYEYEANEEIHTSLIDLWGELFKYMGIDIPTDQTEWVTRQLRFG